MDDKEKTDYSGAPTEDSKSSAVSRGVTYIQTKFQECRAEQKKENPTDRAARRTANATWMIAVFTAVTICVGYAQWRALHNTDEKIGRQLSLIEADQRPWIGVNRVATEVISPGKSLKIRVIFKNGGKNPGLNWTAAMDSPFIQETEEGIFDKVECNVGCSHGLLIPNATFLMDLSLKADFLPDETVADIMAMKRKIYITGRTDYFDNFGKKHRTMICMFYNPKSASFGYCIREGSNYAD